MTVANGLHSRLDGLGRSGERAVADFELDDVLAGRNETFGDREDAECAFDADRSGELAEMMRA